MYVTNKRLLSEVRNAYETTKQIISDHEKRHDVAEAVRYVAVSMSTYIQGIQNFEMGTSGCKSHLSLPQYRYSAIGAILGYRQYLHNTPSYVARLVDNKIDEVILSKLKEQIDIQEKENGTSQEKKDELFIEAILKRKHGDTWMDLGVVLEIIFTGEIK